jgi:hypothetical protein
MIVYHTVVSELPATPLGLLPARWHIEHRCSTCHHTIPADQLIAHARVDHHDHNTDTEEAQPDYRSRATHPGGENRRATLGNFNERRHASPTSGAPPS